MPIAAAPIAAGPIAASPALSIVGGAYFGDTSEVYIPIWAVFLEAVYFGNTSVVYVPRWGDAIYAEYFGSTAEVFAAVWFENDTTYGPGVCVPPTPDSDCRVDCGEAV